MKTTLELLNKIIEMGFDHDKSLEEIDACLDEAMENRIQEDLGKEYIDDELYNNILDGFECKKEYL